MNLVAGVEAGLESTETEFLGINQKLIGNPDKPKQEKCLTYVSKDSIN